MTRVRGLIAEQLGITADQVREDSKLQEDLGLDSLGSYELIFKLEEEFQILVPNERAAELSTVREVCDSIESLRQSAAAGA